ncbi:hypothetical protein HLV37_02460 [Eggerthellaceae bacterium zg-1084]|uniref:Uncharacterized protein n=1 Tax=Berryella wangjianweii TaxID=2734634 RepID=A0A6M8J6Z8_9ACTN|nr:hypothetical protein [Berryella wangjianweii]NPD30742.1 hypothetical protein [Berryella wangjianweii]NPD32039.1 hypothetical protein [Eggerthellaceae bacterium zg-997]QKF07378.1 hypothetical protein HLV38_04025 [Berryella wangjianweii]
MGAFDEMEPRSHRLMAGIALVLWVLSAAPFLWRGEQAIPFLAQLIPLATLVALAFRLGLQQRSEIVAFSLAWCALQGVWMAAGVHLSLVVAQLVIAGLCLFVIFHAHPRRFRERSAANRGVYVCCAVACCLLQVATMVLMALFLDPTATAFVGPKGVEIWTGEGRIDLALMPTGCGRIPAAS